MITLSDSGVKSLFYYAPSITFDGEGNIVVTWTATGMMPCVFEDSDIPITAIFYSKYDTSGTVVSGYDKQTIAVGFNSAVAVNSSGDMVITWNTFDVFTLKVRIMAAIYSAQGGALSGPLEVGMRPDYTPSNFVDTGNYFLNTGIDIAADSAGNFFIAWGGSNILSNQIYLKEIYIDGSYLSNEIQVSQGFDFNYGPSIAVDSQGNIVIAWNKFSLMNLSAGASSVYARRFDNNLQALGDEFKVNVSY